MSNLFILPEFGNSEIFEPLCQADNLLIERIVSFGQVTAAGEWYDQTRHEWVVLLQGKATLLFDHENGEIMDLEAGSYVHIAPHRLHRVIYTSTEPACIWLAIHYMQ